MNKTNYDDPYLSVVIPLLNEEGNIGKLSMSIIKNIHTFGVSYELILVDDGSGDRTWQKIRKLAKSNRNIKGVKLARNFGHQHALLAGLSLAKGQAIISMDGDLQHPPSLIPKMLEEHKKGNLVIHTRRYDTKVVPFFKRLTSSLFYKVFSFLTDISMDSGSSDFRLIDRMVLKQLLELKNVDLFLRGAVEWLGFPSVSIPYEVGKRFAGQSKYTLSKIIKFGQDSLVSFSIKPLLLSIWLGMFTSMLAFMEIIYAIYQWIIGNTVPGWASTVGIISFLFGILFIILGIIGSYLARIYIALQNRPRFIIAEIINHSEAVN